MKNKIKDITDGIDFSAHVYYDPTSPSHIRWVNDRYGGKKNLIRPKGSTAGSRNSEGYWKIIIEGKSYLIHRIIWLLFNKEDIGGLQIDHIDGDPSNNSIENLRLVLPSLNSRNTKQKGTITGITGVSFDSRDGFRGSPCFIAHWRDLNGNYKRKSFSTGKYGFELAEFLASEYRRHMIDMLNLQGAGYSKRHGT